jgi:C4-dicarboxylate transporter, DctM subunit
MLAFGIIVFFILLLTGVPIFISFALGGLIIVSLVAHLPFFNMGIFFFDSVNSWIMLAVPLFIFAGQLMAESGMGKTLVDVMAGFVGRVPGGIGVTAIAASAFCGSLVGSNLAVLGSVGVILYPVMVANKYDKSYCAGLLCAASQLGFLIPPSIVFIIYGFLTQTSVAKLYIAGILPGILTALLLVIPAIYIAKKKGFPPMPRSGFKQQMNRLKRALPAIFMPLIVLGGIYGGIFTPTEAAAVACIYTALVGVLVYRGLNFKNIWRSAIEAARLTAIIMILLCAVMLFSRALNFIGLPQAVGKWVIAQGLSAQGFLFLLCAVFLILGIFMDAFAMVAIMPVVLPAVQQLGIDTIQLGVVFVVASMIGTMTPPAAGAIYFTSSLFKLPTIDTIRGIIPFLGITVVAMFIFAIWPSVSTWLPATMLGSR